MSTHSSANRGMSSRDRNMTILAVVLIVAAIAIAGGYVWSKQGKGTNALAPVGWAKERKMQGQPPAQSTPTNDPNADALGLHQAGK